MWLKVVSFESSSLNGEALRFLAKSARPPSCEIFRTFWFIDLQYRKIRNVNKEVDFF
jgi:hypothetical protein